MNDKKIKRKLNKLKNSIDHIDNNFGGWFQNVEDENILCFWAGTDAEDNKAIKWVIFPIDSAIRNGNSIHIFSSSKETKLNNFILAYLNKWYKEEKEKIKFTIINIEELTIIEKITPLKRARKWGPPNYFSIFNFWLVNNCKYKRINIFHNDIIFNKKINFNNYFDIYTLLGQHSIKDLKKKEILLKNLPVFFNVDKDDFYERHFHTGCLSMSKKFINDYKKFINDNSEKISKKWEFTLFPEQEFTKIVSQLKNYKIFNCNMTMETRITGEELSQEDYYLHLDCGIKETMFLDKKINKEYQISPLKSEIVINETKIIYNKLKKMH